MSKTTRMRTPQLLLFCLLVCQTTESLTDKLVNLGENVTLDCQINEKEIYWVFQKPSDAPVMILRTFSSDATPYVQDQRLKDKYSSLTSSNLFIINITLHELGIYYCVKPGIILQISNGTRLYINDQNQTKDCQQEQSCEKTLELYKILTVTSVLLNSVLIIAIIGLLMIKLKKPRKSRRQAQNVEPEQIEDLNTAQYSEIELPTYSRRENPIQTNDTYELLQKPELHPRSTHAEIITSYKVDNDTFCG